nr:ABC transporter F family member 4-like [Ipomoea batatas]
MERRGKGRHYAYRGRKARSDYKCYEQSDEDYKVCKNEVFDEKKKLCKPQLRKGNGKGMQRKRISEVSKKKTRKKNSRKKISKISKKTTGKKQRKKRRVKRKARFDDGDEESMDINTMEKKTRKNIGVGRRKRRRIIIDSDSDFVTSESSDLEYTISEEEREQVREASKFCRGLTASWRRPAFLKNLPEEKTQRLQKKRSLRKDKEKVEEVKTESGKQICGICLSEEGKKTIRGTLNCCSHYFCFACIMEWSKVESRCPLCKQRFVTISKPAKSSAGFDLRPVVIQVLERDQVYEPSEEELRGYLDPYENVICTECQQGGDDALMLLCDICDSPSHTYCVGLGHEVPEGNWYCEGCRSSSPGFQNPQNSNRTPESRTVNNFSVRLPPIANMRDTFDLNEIYVPDTPLAQEVHCTPSPRDSQAASPASGSVASTVSDRRRIHRRINQFLSNRTRQVDSRTRDNG